jgi:DNA primase
MPRIKDDDIVLVRERARIEDVVSPHVTLRRAGSSMVGLCPFHEEKTPSFHVTPTRGFYYCFGCGSGGSAIDFEMKINNLSYVEAIQSLASRFGVELHYEEDGGRESSAPGLRRRILEANQAAAEFFAAQLRSPEAVAARTMLDGRGFGSDVAAYFSVGYAPKGGRELRAHLTKLKFTDEELAKAGLIRASGGWDFFQGRVLWPIKDSASTVLGFGARRLYDDDRLPAKYINTIETPVYKKSQVLYGLDLARRAMGHNSQAVVMEGYTDVMAAHLSGVENAVASCGTAFGAEHARLLQRIMGVTDVQQGGVTFTFDGDEAGQKAALKVFALDASFTSQTYVAVDPEGLDPCDLRIKHGDSAIPDLIGRRIPLYRFVMQNTLAGFDLDRADGRLSAVRAAAPLVTSERDDSLVSGYLRELAQMVGMDIDQVRKEVAAASKRAPVSAGDGAGRGRGSSRAGQARGESQGSSVSSVGHSVDGGPADGSGARREELGDLSGGATGQSTFGVRPPLPYPDPNEVRGLAQRGTLQLLLQTPELFASDWNGLAEVHFTHPTYRAVFAAVLACEYSATDWAMRVQQATQDETARQVELELLVETPLRVPTVEYAMAHTSKLQLDDITRQRNELRSKLQRMNPVTHTDEYQPLFEQLVALEQWRTKLTADAAILADD